MNATPASVAQQDSPHQIVLIAEDDEPIALALSLIVEDAGFVPVVAADGREALALAHARRPALIITDLMMPRMSGSQFLLALRGELDTLGYRPQIVVMTATDLAFTRDLGADAVIAKPFDISAVEELLLKLLAR